MTADWKYRPLGWMVKGLSLLPFWALYLHADLLYLLLYYVVGYRKRVVRKNLTESFPDKSERELLTFERQFFRNFADYIVETIKLLHISDAEMRRRMTFSNVGLIDDALKAGKPVVCYFAHIGNWEWAPSITQWSSLTPGKDAEFCQIYRPLRNQWFDSLMLKIRSRFGAVSLPKRRSFLDLLRYKKRGMPTVTGFMSDQKPSHGDPVHIVRFLNHPTAVITGTETVANRLDALTVYWHLTKPSRGHYHIDVRPIEPNPAFASPYPLTDSYIRLLEANIRENPALWLWSHKRWKNPVEMPAEATENPPLIGPNH